jgi:hypothetical protein
MHPGFWLSSKIPLQTAGSFFIDTQAPLVILAEARIQM